MDHLANLHMSITFPTNNKSLASLNLRKNNQDQQECEITRLPQNFEALMAAPMHPFTRQHSPRAAAWHPGQIGALLLRQSVSLQLKAAQPSMSPDDDVHTFPSFQLRS
eukprot:5055472-Amphidinium_carterae.1